MLGGAGKLAGHVNAGGTSSENVNSANENKESASTSEGGISVAAAVTVNIQSTEALAEIGDGATVIAEVKIGDDNDGSDDNNDADEEEEELEAGKVAVISLANNESEVTANGQASAGKVGVGVAVAINTVSYSNEALIGDSSIEADSLEVRADFLEVEEDEEEEETQTPDEEEEKNWFNKLLEDAVTELVEKATGAIGFGDSEVISGIVTETLTEAINALLDGTGLEQLIENQPLDQLKGNLENLKALLMSVPGELKEPVVEAITEAVKKALKKSGLGDAAGDAAASAQEVAEVVQAVAGDIGDLQSEITRVVREYLKTETWTELSKTLLNNITDSVESKLKDYLQSAGGMSLDEIEEDVINSLIEIDYEGFGDGLNQLGDEIADEVAAQVEGALKSLYEDTVEAVLNRITTLMTDAEKFPGKLEDAADKFENLSLKPDDFIQALQEELSKPKFQNKLKNAIAAKFKKVAANAVDTMTDGICDVDTVRAFFGKELGDHLIENLKNALMAGGKALTNGALDALTDALGVKLTEESDEPGHSFKTQAIAGASADGVSVAGSVAIAVISGKTTAKLADAAEGSEHTVSVAGDLVIRATANQTEETTATAAEASDGEADANTGAGANDEVKSEATPESVQEVKEEDKDDENYDKTIATIYVGEGGTVEIENREIEVADDQAGTVTVKKDAEVTVKADDDKRLRDVTLSFKKADGTEIKLPVTLEDGKFTVPRIVKENDEWTLTIGSDGYVVKEDTEFTYNIRFVPKETVSKDNLDASWEGEGAISIESGSSAGHYTIKVDPDDGYMLPENTITITYVDGSGDEQAVEVILSASDLESGLPVSVTRSGSGDDEKTTLTIGSWSKEIDDGEIVGISAQFIGKYTLTVDGMGEADADENDDGSFSQSFSQGEGVYENVFKVLNLQALDDGKELHAAYKDRITVIVNPGYERSLDSLTLTYTEGGETKTQTISTKEPSVVDEDGGTAYIFYMPNANATLTPVFKAEKEEEEGAKTASGNSVGVGAGFAMTYSSLKVEAGIGANRVVEAGTADIRANSEHTTQTSGVAGTDPLETATSGETTQTDKKIAIDAAIPARHTR